MSDRRDATVRRGFPTTCRVQDSRSARRTDRRDSAAPSIRRVCRVAACAPAGWRWADRKPETSLSAPLRARARAPACARRVWASSAPPSPVRWTAGRLSSIRATRLRWRRLLADRLGAGRRVGSREGIVELVLQRLFLLVLGLAFGRLAGTI